MRVAVCFLLCMILSPEVFGGAEAGLENLLTPAEARQYHAKADYRSRMDVLRQALERYGQKVRREVRNVRYSMAVETLTAIRTITLHGVELTEAAAQPRDFRSRKVRKLEIRLRKLSEMLDDLKSAPPFEYRAGFEQTVTSLDDFRRRLLDGYFQDSNRSPNSLQRGRTPAADWLARPAAPQARLRSTVAGDQFTADEEDAIREAQELRPRVKVLLGIAEARLDEIARRLAQQPWEDKNPNPLEFFTNAQMMRAYCRALEVVMINVDEKAKFGTASEKEIRRSLKLINQQMQTFLPQLKPLRALAIEQQDQDLFVEVRKAQKISEQALRGSQLGLGSPSR